MVEPDEQLRPAASGSHSRGYGSSPAEACVTFLQQSKTHARQLEEMFAEGSVVEQSRQHILQAATQSADAYLRSPACLQVMKQQLDALIASRRTNGCTAQEAESKLAETQRRPDQSESRVAPVSKDSKSSRGVTPHAVVYRCGTVKLLHYRGQGCGIREPVLICYSLVNRPYILDMLPQRSVVRRLLQQRFDVYLIDWGTPTAAERTKSMADYICDDLRQIVDLVRRRAQSQQVNLLGYCMGGTMSAIYAALYPEQIRNLILMAAPIEFGDRAGLLGAWANKEILDVDRLIDAFGNCPGELLNYCFQMMKPVQNFHEKYVTLMQKLDDSEFLMNFRAMERWTSDNIPVAGETFREFVKYCYQENLLARGGLKLRGRAVNLGDIKCPLLLVTADYDHLVPSSSSLALAQLAASQNIETLSAAVGHVGLAVSRKAHDQLWPAACQWIARHSTQRQEQRTQADLQSEALAQATKIAHNVLERNASVTEQDRNMEALHNSRFFQNLDEEHLKQLAGIAHVVEYPARQTMFSEFDQANDVYVLVSGDVSVVVCEPKVGCRQLTTVRDGELLGWSPLLERGRMAATAVTLTPTKAIVINGKGLVELCKNDPALGYEFMTRTAQVLSERLFATRVQLLEMSGVHFPEVTLESD